MTTIIVLVIIIAFGYLIYSSFLADTAAGPVIESAFGWIQKTFWFLMNFVMLFILGIFVVPAMYAMTVWYPLWETWIKEIGSIKNSIPRVLLLIPLSVVVMIAMLIMQLLHKPFEDRVDATFGKKLF
jgi:hypothetical protein